MMKKIVVYSLLWCYAGLTITFGLLVSTATPYVASIWEVWDVPVAGPYLLGNFFLGVVGILLTVLLFNNQYWATRGLLLIGIGAIGLGAFFLFHSYATRYSIYAFVNWAVLPIIIHGAILMTLFRIKDGNVG